MAQITKNNLGYGIIVGAIHESPETEVWYIGDENIKKFVFCYKQNAPSRYFRTASGRDFACSASIFMRSPFGSV